jgi:hypothetical protein
MASLSRQTNSTLVPLSGKSEALHIDITANTPRLLNYTAKAQVQYT